MSDGVRYTFIGANNEDDLTHVSGRELVPILKEIGAKTGIEIGVDEAPTSWFFLKNRPDLKLYGVDPYQGYQDWYPGGFISQHQQDEKYINMQRRTEEFGDRWKHYRLTSDDAVRLFDDNAYDFIFIDGNHTYDATKKDFENAVKSLIPCLAEKPTNGEFWCLLGDIYYCLKDYERAKSFYENAKILGSRRLNDDDYPMEISKYKEYPEKLIKSCDAIKQSCSIYSGKVHSRLISE